MIQTLNPYLGCALRRGVDVPSIALGWVHQSLLISPLKTTNPVRLSQGVWGQPSGTFSHTLFVCRVEGFFSFVSPYLGLFFHFPFFTPPPFDHAYSLVAGKSGESLFNSLKARTCRITCVPEIQTVLLGSLSDIYSIPCISVGYPVSHSCGQP